MKDVITGLFILLEDQFSVGDYVKIGQFEGVVLEIGLRTTKVKSWTGEIHTFTKRKYRSGYQLFS